MAPIPPSTSPPPSQSGWTGASFAARELRVRPAEPEAAGELGGALGVAPAIAQLLLQRGMRDPELAREFLQPKLSGLSQPDAMADREAAADRLARAVRSGECIVVFGDYDVDGTTSAAVLAGILEQLGGHVRALTANRFEGGYGFSQPALQRAVECSPGLIVTCDCGSSDHERLAQARRAGIDVIVVDHHLVPAEPLPALAFLNPHRPECGFPYKGLCSAGLALSLGAAVRARIGAKLDLRGWLDLVALGTIADVAPLDGDNRRLVRAGLMRLASPGARPGVVALREVAKLRAGAALSAMDVAFRMTPRLNAPGRLGDQSLTLSLLRARSVGEARALAARIEQINQQRKEIEQRVTSEAVAQVLELYGEAPDCGVVVAGESWHRGVVGISAARLVERFGVPVVVVALQDGHGHGSCRAPEGFPLFDAVSRCSAELERFGGHHAASGVSLRSERLEAFRSAFAGASRELASGTPARDLETADLAIAIDGYHLPPASQLALLEPLGESNREPLVLLPEARVEASKRVGEGHLKLALSVGDDRLSAFGLGMGDRCPEPGCAIAAAGRLRPDGWAGGEAVELRVLAFGMA